MSVPGEQRGSGGPAGALLRSVRPVIGSSAPARGLAKSACITTSLHSSSRAGSALPGTFPYRETVKGTNPTTRSAAIHKADAPSFDREPFDHAGPLPTMNAVATTPASTDRKSTRLNSSHLVISYAVFCL